MLLALAMSLSGMTAGITAIPLAMTLDSDVIDRTHGDAVLMVFVLRTLFFLFFIFYFIDRSSALIGAMRHAN